MYPREGGVAEEEGSEPASQRPRLTHAAAQQDGQASAPPEPPAVATSEATTPPALADQSASEGESLTTPEAPASAVNGTSPAVPVSEGPGTTGSASVQDQQVFAEAADAGREGAGLIAAVSAEGNQKMEEHFQPSVPMQEMVVNFLLRMAFVIGGDKEHELQVKHMPVVNLQFSMVSEKCLKRLPDRSFAIACQVF